MSLSACVFYPHAVPVNPRIEGNLVSAENNAPVAGAELSLNIGSDMSRTYTTTSDASGRFAFPAHSDLRLIALLADAPGCGTTLSVQAPGYKTRHCSWMSMHWCSAAELPAFENLALIPDHLPIEYADLSVSTDSPCRNPL